MQKQMHILTKLLLLVILTGSSIMSFDSYANVKAIAESRRQVDLCKPYEERQVVIVINIGTVMPSDSLYGFNIELSYNPEKILLHTGLYTGNLSEAFDTKSFNFDNENGKAWGYATNIKNVLAPPVFGNKNLVGIVGEYIGNDTDTAIVTISYIEFTEEFKKEINEYVPAVVYADYIPKENLELNTVPSASIIEMKHDEAGFVDLSFETNNEANPKQMLYTIEITEGEFIISDIELFSNDNIDISTHIISGKNAEVNLVAFDNYSLNNLFRVEVKKDNTDLATTGTLRIIPSSDSPDNCIKYFNYAEIQLIGHKKPNDTTSVKYDSNDNIIAYVNDNELIIKSENTRMTKVDIYNSMGQISNISQIFEGEHYRQNLDGLSNGLYLAVIKFTDNTIKTIKFIK